VVSSVLPKRSRLIFDAVEDSAEGMSMYDDVEEVVAAVQCRLSRRQLPKITEDGFVEYGLILLQGQLLKVRAEK